MVELKRIFNSSVLAISLAFGGTGFILVLAVAVHMLLAAAMIRWVSAAGGLPASAQYAGYAGGVAAVVIVGFGAPRVGRWAGDIENRVVREVVVFGLGILAMAFVLGVGLFANWCVPWGRDLPTALAVAFHVFAFAAMAFGAWGAVKTVYK